MVQWFNYQEIWRLIKRERINCSEWVYKYTYTFAYIYINSIFELYTYMHGILEYMCNLCTFVWILACIFMILSHCSIDMLKLAKEYNLRVKAEETKKPEDIAIENVGKVSILNIYIYFVYFAFYYHTVYMDTWCTHKISLYKSYAVMHLFSL